MKVVPGGWYTIYSIKRLTDMSNFKNFILVILSWHSSASHNLHTLELFHPNDLILMTNGAWLL